MQNLRLRQLLQRTRATIIGCQSIGYWDVWCCDECPRVPETIFQFTLPRGWPTQARAQLKNIATGNRQRPRGWIPKLVPSLRLGVWVLIFWKAVFIRWALKPQIELALWFWNEFRRHFFEVFDFGWCQIQRLIEGLKKDRQGLRRTGKETQAIFSFI